MTFARYYATRNSKPGADNDKLVIPIVNSGGLTWTWAAVRGRNADGTRLTSISLVDGLRSVTLTAPVVAGSPALVNSKYEIVIGDAASSPDDASVVAAGKPVQDRPGIDPVGNTGWAMDRDPPPPPALNWAFQTPTVSL